MTHPETIEKIRLNNARALAKRAGSAAKFAAKVGMTDKLASNYIGINPNKMIGSEQARKIEAALQLPIGWLDVQHEDEELATERGQMLVTEPDELLLQIVFHELPAAERAQMLSFAEILMEQKSPDYSAQELMELDLFRRLSESGRQLLLKVAENVPKLGPVTLPDRAGIYPSDQLVFMARYLCATHDGKGDIEKTLHAKLRSEGGDA